MNDHIASLHEENQSYSRDLMSANIRERELLSQIEKSDADVAELQELIEQTQKAINEQTEFDRVRIATLELKLESDREESQAALVNAQRDLAKAMADYENLSYLLKSS